MRKYQEYRDQARGMTLAFCLLLATAVIGTIVFSALAVAGLTTAIAYGYMSEMTTIEMPAGYWSDIFAQRLLQAGVAIALVVVGTAVYCAQQLSEGGGRWLARSLGGTRVLGDSTDPSHVKALNVVEELALATSLRPPPVYILEDEPGINAFAAGLEPGDAVIGVTRGAIDKLRRDQLEGVIAHEFSHIKNGDMRLNVRLLGILTGVQSIALAARYLIRLATDDKADDRHALGRTLALAFGAVLWPIGQIGALSARLIHLAVNRQREFLADASAVQITRDPEGLCGALRMLLEEASGSALRGPKLQLVSHMFFAAGEGRWQRLLETHPPLAERIRRLDPALVAAGQA